VDDVEWWICLLDRVDFGCVETNHKIMINRVHGSPPSILIIRKPNGLRESG
jgi:hypothetical protein